MSEKPCPFCGSKEVLEHSYKEDNQDWHSVYCSNCGANFQTNKMEYSVEKWNTRPTPDLAEAVDVIDSVVLEMRGSRRLSPAQRKAEDFLRRVKE